MAWPIPREARTALRALEGAEVGVYERSAGGGMGSRSTMVAAADRAMAARGWERVVGVAERQQMVLVYVPRNLPTWGRAQVCVAVVSERELVVALARAKLKPLLELAQEACSQAFATFPKHDLQTRVNELTATRHVRNHFPVESLLPAD